MVFGLIALVVRYLSFYVGGIINQSWMYYIGILIHGLIFGFFYVGGQIYIDKKAPSELKSQAQGFIFLVTFGLGLLLGNLISGGIINHYSGVNGYNWNAIWGITTIFSVVLLLGFTLLFKNEQRISVDSDAIEGIENINSGKEAVLEIN